MKDLETVVLYELTTTPDWWGLACLRRAVNTRLNRSDNSDSVLRAVRGLRRSRKVETRGGWDGRFEVRAVRTGHHGRVSA